MLTSIHRWFLGLGSSLHPPLTCSLINNIAFPVKNTGSQRNIYVKDSLRLCTIGQKREMRTMGKKETHRHGKGLTHKTGPAGDGAMTWPSPFSLLPSSFSLLPFPFLLPPSLFPLLSSPFSLLPSVLA